MLVHVGFFILSFAGVWSYSRPPPCDTDPLCPKNEHFTRNNPRCIRTCANVWVPISDDCKPYTGCVCDGNLVRLHDDGSGPCVPRNKCPCRSDPKNPRDQVYTAQADSIGYAEISKEKTVSDVDGTSFGHYRSRSSSLSKSSASYKSVISSDCEEPINCPKNSYYVVNDNRCPKTCGNRLLPNSDTAGACAPFTGCFCEPGFVRKNDNATGPCIRERKCPPIPTQCDVNEEPTSCRIICPPQTCDSIFSSYYCLPTECEPGCDCLNGYLRNSDGDCIPSDDCFKPDPIECGPDEVPTDCQIECPPQSCESLFTTYMCAETNCTPGCNCIDGYLRNSLGICVPSEECYTDPSGCNGDINAVRVRDCGSACPPTCAEPEPELCTSICVLNGCECKPGYILSEPDGDCIEPGDCPGGSPCCGANKTYVGCTFECPTIYCPSDDSRAQVACSPPYPCLGGCACIPGYLVVSRDDRRCVLASDCPEVDCTRPNEVWDRNPSNCFLERCDDRGKVCDYPYPAGPRCVCQDGYYRNESDICVPECECPPLGCKGDLNATLTRCPTPCPKTCDDPNAGNEGCIEICLPEDCQCNPGYVLTTKDGGICIKHEDCPGQGCGGDENAVYSECRSACEPSCRNPDPNQLCTLQCLPPGCECKPGFVRPGKGEKCIKPEDCPGQGCNGDRNATYKECPSACPLTCAEPDPNRPCIDMCAPSGCECNTGYVLENGICIKPEDCPVLDVGCNGDLNATHNDCPSACPTTCEDGYRKGVVYCPDVCDPSGCECKQGYILTEKGGICIKPEDCPVLDVGCNGDLNATYNECPSSCPTTCGNRFNTEEVYCPTVCDPSYCVCKPGYILTEKGGICIKPEDCPEPGCEGDANAEYSDCPSACQATCDNPDTNQPCTRQCLPPGCVCKAGYIRIEKDGKCIKQENCPDQGCGGDPNAVLSECPSACEQTCSSPKNQICTLQCMPPGCVCKPGYVLTEEGGICIKPENCPGLGCNGDLNATYTECTSGCPLTCDNRDQGIVCAAVCNPPGCRCNPGYVLDKDGKCILPEDCPEKDQGCGGDENAEFKECPSACEPSCRNPDPNQLCTMQCLPPGCVCKPGFVSPGEGENCIRPEDCPERGCGGDENAVYSECPSACEPSCANPDPNQPCTLQCLPPGCVCKPGYVVTEKGGICIKPENCPGLGCNGDLNATYTDCTSGCPLTCDNRDQGIACAAVCHPPGCQCNPGYVLDKDGKCILPEDCPEKDQGCGGDDNAEYSNCPSACEPSCANPDPNQPCTKQCMPPGCVCKPGYVVTEKGGICIKPENCPGLGCNGDLNATYTDCTSACPRTCDDQDPYRICSAVCYPPGCQCNPGYVLGKDGKCILPEDCPAEPQCNGDRNATYKECPAACQATCRNPDPGAPCIEICMSPACVCKPGYILNKTCGQCIKPEDCPGGSPRCGVNETYVYCKVGCPNNYCPGDDSRAIIACDPMWPCPGGCACKGGYLMISEEDDRCILSSECPPVECTRPNEVWDPNAPGCLHERCDDKDIPCDFQYPGPPRCVCIEGYYRNLDDICVPEYECPVQGCEGDKNATFSECPSHCPATCSEPESNRPCITSCAEPGCVCNEGYILSELGGSCIRPYDCPGGSPHCCENMTYVSCVFECPMNYCPEDENEITIICDPVWPCPPGCACKPGYLMPNKADRICILAADCPPLECTRPNEVWDPRPSKCNYERCDQMYYVCDDTSPGRPKCVCKEGYYKDQNGVCIPAEECPKPKCGYNEVEVPCRQICPPQNCEIAYTDYACTNETEICEPGCNCLPDHLRNGSGICIPNEECPYPSTPVCGINEIARDCRRICPPQTCISKYALFRCIENIPCESGCDCVPNYLRDSSGKCIPSEQCPEPCPIPDECKRTCTDPNPPNCEYNPPKENNNGCDCKEGFILSELGGNCIPIDECPSDKPCNGDPNARVKRCPSPCPSTCEVPNEVPCLMMCEPVGCQCNPGYLLSNVTGRCILPDKCPGGNPCGENEHFVDCKRDCRNDYCPVDDSRDRTCDPPTNTCLSGCVCDLNHKMKSREDRTCIVSSDCPPVDCRRPNEEWCSCPSACLAEDCKDVNNQPTVCNTLVLNCEPACICIKDHFRNASGICIPAEDCLTCPIPDECKRTCTDPNPPNCEYNPPQENNDGCDCKEGFILSELGGDCIPIDECPSNITCNGDPNAKAKRCPKPCPSTCDAPNQSPCKRMCEPIGCQCNPGYLLSNVTGRCILPDECPGGNPCGENGRFVDCKTNCRNDYCPVDDSRDRTCEPPDMCLSGCICDLNHKMKSLENRTCIVSSDCPPVKCTRPNEEWCSCPSACLAEDCKDVNNQPTVCNTLVLNCEPACICIKDYFRNASGICIPAEDCPC